ncbi:MAG: hypothetical protein JRI68_29020 [Deltaproteobacteria bacterium]|nr:hypothetical protein [Deltaproteobacteria bacterium]
MTSGSDRPQPDPTGTRGASLARDVLERAFGQLDELPAAAAGDQLLAAYDEARIALDRLAGAALRDPHYLDYFDAACTALESLARGSEGLHHRGAERFARRVAGAAAALAKRREQVLDEMVAVQGAAAPSSQQDTDDQAPRPFHVSRDLPVLQDVTPTSLGLVTPTHPPPGPGGEPVASLGDGQLNELARSCLAEMGRMSRLCHLDGDRPWSSVVVRFEERVLANLDAVMGLCRPDLAPAAPRLEPVVVPPVDAEQPGEDQTPNDDWPSPVPVSSDSEPSDGQTTAGDRMPPPPDRVVGKDPSGLATPTVTTGLPPLELVTTVELSAALADYTGEAPGDADRAFVRSFVLGSLDGEQPVRAAVMSLRRAPRATLASHGRAFSLAPNPAIVAEMEKLCHDDEPQLTTTSPRWSRSRWTCYGPAESPASHGSAR